METSLGEVQMPRNSHEAWSAAPKVNVRAPPGHPLVRLRQQQQQFGEPWNAARYLQSDPDGYIERSRFDTNHEGDVGRAVSERPALGEFPRS